MKVKTALIAAGAMCLAGIAGAQDADLTILVEGDLLEHGGVVEVTAVAHAGAATTAQTITLSQRYAQVELLHLPDANYVYRFRPVPDALDRDGMDKFATEALKFGGRTVDGPDGPVDGDWRSVRVLPFEEYGGVDSATRTNAAWGETMEFAALPPANHWGARAMAYAFDTFGDRRTVGLICDDQAGVQVCTPDPDDALLWEALWWRSIAEGRLGRLNNDALKACYDSGGLLNRPKRCEGVPGRGWPTYEPVE
ncbi:MAG: hypothetical protein AB8B82_13575 [Roseovarius sp.]